MKNLFGSDSRGGLARNAKRGGNDKSRSKKSSKNSEKTIWSKRTFVADLAEGAQVDAVFRVTDVSMSKTGKGNPYLKANAVDKTGSIPVRMWDATEQDHATFRKTGFVRLRADVDSYKGMRQLKVSNVLAVLSDEVFPEDFFEKSTRDADKMHDELLELVRSVSDADFSRLLQAVFIEDKPFAEKFKKHPAAKEYHHAWVSGLLEHTLSVTRTALAMVEARGKGSPVKLDRDTVTIGALLHDIGKVFEVGDVPGSDYTDAGYLLGHVVAGALFTDEKMRAIGGFPEEKRLLVLHMIVSHHGEKEFGSPVVPATPEAILLHYCDNLDAKVQAASKAIEAPVPEGVRWTEYKKMLGGRIYRGKGKKGT